MTVRSDLLPASRHVEMWGAEEVYRWSSTTWTEVSRQSRSECAGKEIRDPLQLVRDISRIG